MLRYGNGCDERNGKACRLGRRRKRRARDSGADGAVLADHREFWCNGLAILVELDNPHTRGGAQNDLRGEFSGGRTTGNGGRHVQNRDGEPDGQAR